VLFLQENISFCRNQKYTKGGIKMQVKVVKATSASTLQTKINAALQSVGESFVDLKISGAYDGSSESFIAVILYK
jgi:hypothetical protein